MAKGLQMKTSNQTNLRGFIFRMLKPITRAIALAQGLAVILAAPAATAQTRPAATATNTVVSTAEVTAFMQSFRQGGLDAVSKISLNPKRVPLLLAAIEREPAGLWVTYLQGICFHVEHAAARKLPPARRSEVYARAIEYLAAAKETVSKALEADPQNRQLKHNLGTLDEGLALAYVESGTRIKEARALAEAVLAANTETNDWNYGNVIYDMHSLLGRIALREGDVAAAKRHLVESGKTPGSPQLNSFGPDFVLAGELLQKGERDVVLEHLDKIAVFWANPDRNPSGSSLPLEHQKQIEKWKQTIRAGQIPDDHGYKWPVAGLSFVTSSPVDETGTVQQGGAIKEAAVPAQPKTEMPKAEPPKTEMPKAEPPKDRSPNTSALPNLSDIPAPKQGDVGSVDLGDRVKMELVFVPEGSGGGGFWAGKYEVTNAQYRQFVKDSGYDGSGEANSDYLKHFKGSVKESSSEADYPVVWVSWNNAKAFCAWLSKKTGRSFGLPTEKQWEFACRAGSTGDYCFGSDAGQLGEYAWYGANSGVQTHPVGKKKPNAFGLYDVHGNVWEWCEDAEGGSRVLRGGSWGSAANYCRASSRSMTDPAGSVIIYGFRVVCVPGQAAAPGAPLAGGAANGAGIITSAGFIVTSGGFIAFTNAGSAENHEKEIEAWNREGATLTTEQARELERKWVANPRDEPTLVRLLSYRLVHYGDEYPARANAEKVGRLYASLIEMDPYSSVAWAEGMSRLSPLVADPKCFEIIARKWIFLAKQNSNDNYIIKQAGTFLMLSPKDKSYFKQGESLLQQLAQRDPESALSYGNLCLDQAGPCFDRPEGDPKLAAKALIALQNAEKLMPAKSREHVQPGLFSSLTKAAFWAGQYPLAEKYAGRWLKEVRQRSADSAGLAPNRRLGQEMDLGDAIHQANSILGEIALSRGDTKRAAEHLVASGKVATPSPSLASYGPDLALMKDLLALKEKRAVLEFLDECGSFWHGSEGRPASWKQAIESGNNPDFGAGFKTHFKRLK